MKITALMRWSLFLSVITLVLVGCASVSVRNDSIAAKATPRAKPDIIYVRDFDLSAAEINVDRTGDELKQFKTDTVEAISKTLIADLLKFYPAQRLAKGAPTPSGNYLLLEGRITKINQGSRALRMIVGFGAGGTKMETTISLYDASTTPIASLLTFDTTGGSGAEPGMATSADPVGAAGSAAGGAAKGVSDDTKRTGRMIAYRISQYLGENGWITPDKVKECKMSSD